MALLIKNFALPYLKRTRFSRIPKIQIRRILPHFYHSALTMTLSIIKTVHTLFIQPFCYGSPHLSLGHDT
jgi:hypothetical protein